MSIGLEVWKRIRLRSNYGLLQTDEFVNMSWQSYIPKSSLANAKATRPSSPRPERSIAARDTVLVFVTIARSF
jgi:hypothetical protein